jgi:hypothetical protein
MQQLVQGLAFYSFAEEQVQQRASGGDGGDGGSKAWLRGAEEALGRWAAAELEVAAALALEQQRQGCNQAAAGGAGGETVIDALRPGLLAPPPGAVHRTLPPLLVAELSQDGGGAYKLRRRVSGSARRDKRPSAGRRRAISEFSVREEGRPEVGVVGKRRVGAGRAAVVPPRPLATRS